MEHRSRDQTWLPVPPDTKNSALWLAVFLPGFAILGFLVFVTLLTPAPQGDLTRVGRISETAFAARHPSPAVDVQALVQSPIDAADVLVIGDSFSAPLLWQSILVQNGYRVATTHWDQIGGLCRDFPAWSMESGFTGHFVIIESIQRFVSQRVERAEQCTEMSRPFRAVHGGATPLRTPSSANVALNWQGEFTTGLRTYLRTRAIAATREKLSFGRSGVDVVVDAHPLPNGCSVFSNLLCDKGLFLNDDATTPELSTSTADLMQRLSVGDGTARIVWMVIPDKTTVYLGHRYPSAFVEAFEAAALGPNLFDFAAKARTETLDLYAPNDTHLSVAGYLVFGERMLQYLESMKPTKPAIHRAAPVET